ncbi:hypothetical protein OAI84_00485, partial [bacterium]|nr:hypothetical protein [bacterium]
WDAWCKNGVASGGGGGNTPIPILSASNLTSVTKRFYATPGITKTQTIYVRVGLNIKKDSNSGDDGYNSRFQFHKIEVSGWDLINDEIQHDLWVSA